MRDIILYTNDHNNKSDNKTEKQNKMNHNYVRLLPK